MLLAVLVSFACASCSAEPTRDRVTEPTTTAQAPTPVKPSGDASIHKGDLHAHVTHLASDQLQGRETDTAGAKLAADYLAERFGAYGLAPLPGRDGFLVDYKLQRTGYDPNGTAVLLEVEGTTTKLRPGTDFSPFFFSAQGSEQAEVGVRRLRHHGGEARLRRLRRHRRQGQVRPHASPHPETRRTRRVCSIARSTACSPPRRVPR